MLCDVQLLAVATPVHLAHGTQRLGAGPYLSRPQRSLFPLQDMATKVLMAAKDIYQNHEQWAAAGVAISSMPSGKFLLKSGADFFNGYRKVGPRARAPALKCLLEEGSQCWLCDNVASKPKRKTHLPPLLLGAGTHPGPC